MRLKQGDPACRAENAALQAQMAELYKSNSSNAQRILTLLDAQQESMSKIANLERLLSEAVKTAVINDQRLVDATELVREKDGIIQILRDELSMHQLELGQREEQLKQVRHALLDAKAENSTLLERWMSLKEDQISKMNEANEYVETALRSKASVSSRRPSYLAQSSDKELGNDNKLAAKRSILPEKVVKRWVNQYSPRRATMAI